MKLYFSSSKPISSPGRVGSEKFPPPLMRFLRSNRSRSRTRSRARKSPLFFMKKKTPTVETQEPSSPKVTCMGQVRARRAKTRKPDPNKKHCHCHCHCSFWCKPIRRTWARVICCGSAQTEPNRAHEETEDERESVERENEINNNNDNLLELAPPKNALLLTRCRSAPYRSSSLACRFWGSPQKTEDEEREKTEEEERRERIPTLGKEVDCSDSLLKSRDENGGERIGEESVGNGAAIDEELKEKPPLMKLMRSRSEPARSGSEKLDPLTSNFWRERRLSNTESCTPQSGGHGHG